MKDLRKILLVDDESDFLSVSTSFLRKSGFDVHSCTDGREVFPAVKNYNPDLIILDVKLNDQDGRTICRQLKNDLLTKGIKIILQSAFPDVGREYHIYGAEEFILKPYTIDHLLSRIKYHLKII